MLLYLRVKTETSPHIILKWLKSSGASLPERSVDCDTRFVLRSEGESVYVTCGSSKCLHCVNNMFDFIEQGLQENSIRTVPSVVSRISWQGTVCKRDVEMNLSPFKTEMRIGNGSFDNQERHAFHYSSASNCSFRGMRVRQASCNEVNINVLGSSQNQAKQLMLTPVRPFIDPGLL